MMMNTYLKYTLGLASIFLPLMAAAQTVSVARYWGDRQAAVSLTFDDGLQEHYTLVAPHLDRYGLKGTFGINGKYMGDIDDHYAPRMTWDECREMAANGHEICNHSWSHPNLAEVDPATLRMEIEKNDSAILAETGTRPASFLYPFNAWTPQVRAACEKGKAGSRISQFALGQRNSACTADAAAAWLCGLMADNAWGVAMTHGIYTAWDQWDEPWILWDFFRELAFKRDSVWTDTFSRVQAYVKERDSVTLATGWNGDEFIITPTLKLDSRIFHMPLTLKIAGLDSGRCIQAVQGDKPLLVYDKGNHRLIDFDPYGPPVRLRHVASDPLRGKTLCVIGDSYVSNHGCPASETWHAKVAAKHGMKYLNYGINGNSIAFRRDSIYGEPLQQRYGIIPREADYILVIAGHNDAYLIDENPMRRDTLRLRMDRFLKDLKAAHPQARIAWVTPWNVAADGFPFTLSLIGQVCQTNGIPVLDAACASGIRPNDPTFRRRYFQGTEDMAHLNNAGHDLLVHWGEQLLMTIDN